MVADFSFFSPLAPGTPSAILQIDLQIGCGIVKELAGALAGMDEADELAVLQLLCGDSDITLTLSLALSLPLPSPLTCRQLHVSKAPFARELSHAFDWGKQIPKITRTQ